MHYKWQGPYCAGSMMSEFLDSYRDYAPDCRVCREDTPDGDCTCDEKEDLYREQWDDQWGGPVHCCIRAGLDMAANPSGGVVGFTIGDLRKMYPEGVPEWVCPPDEELQDWPFGGDTALVFGTAPDETQFVL